jgi:RNA polymerase sigma-70 factor (ECF subfamily)
MTDTAWMNAALTAARPQAIGALLRYFRDFDTAEEAFQDACLRALKSWPQNGPPRDPTAWLILVGRNAALDGVRRRSRHAALPPDDAISDLGDLEHSFATTCFDSCSSAAIRNSPSRSRSHWRCGSFRAFQ